MTRVKLENIQRQVTRLNTLTEKTYKLAKDEMVNRYCLLDDNSTQITAWYKIGQFWDVMYSMIRLSLSETEKPIVWESELDTKHEE